MLHHQWGHRFYCYIYLGAANLHSRPIFLCYLFSLKTKHPRSKPTQGSEQKGRLETKNQRLLADADKRVRIPSG